MTEPLQVSIQAALCSRLSSPALDSPATAIAMPLVAFDPAGKSQYIDARAVLRAAPNHPGVAFTGSTLHRGIFQVDAVVKDGTGEAAGLRLAELIAARFAIGTALVAGSYKLQIVKVPTIAAAVKDAPWVRFPVSIPYLVIA